MQADDLVFATFLERIRAVAPTIDGPLLVALDGRSGAGKSTLAAAVKGALPSCEVIEGDCFYSGGTPEQWDSRSAAEKADGVIDWRRQRPVLAALASGNPASWHGYDWETFDDRLELKPTRCLPAEIVILEGAYSARPELADLLHLRVLLDTSLTVRRSRLGEREGDAYSDEWFARWDQAERYYFGQVMPPAPFDLVL